MVIFQAATSMSNGLLRTFNLDPICQKDAVLFADTEDKKFWASPNPKVPLFVKSLSKIYDANVGGLMGV